MAEETKITLKLGVIASLIAGLIISVFGAIFNLHGRVTVVETDGKHVSATLCEIKDTVKEIRDDQKRREKYEVGK